MTPNETDIKIRFQEMRKKVAPLYNLLIQELDCYDPTNPEQNTRIRDLEYQIRKLERECWPDLSPLWED